MNIYNVMTKKKQPFKPLNDNNVSVYACGITVNGDAHLGHARQAIVFNMITEYLRMQGYNVKYVRNYTDIDDKIIAQAKEQGIEPLELSNERIKATDDIMAQLVTRDADIKPRVSEFINDIIDFVKQLIDKGYAYQSKGDVYFDVAKDNAYGKLSNRNTKDLMKAVRIESNEDKRDALDFALWKGVGDNEFGWDSPWGKGRPGWHIECSTMIHSLLGDSIDIHGGGKDLVFPHHENEIAQSEALTGKQLANFWVHNGLITVNGTKMSKSMNNFVTIKQLLDEYSPETVRLLILSNHYASPLEVNKALLVTAEKHLYSFYTQLDEYRSTIDKSQIDKVDVQNTAYYKLFVQSMDNDFNISLFLAELYGIFADIAKSKGDAKRTKATELLATLQYVYPVSGLFCLPQGKFVDELKHKYLKQFGLTEQYVLDMIQQRKDAKANKDYQLADQIRNTLIQQGIAIMDSQQGTSWGINFDAVKQ